VALSIANGSIAQAVSRLISISATRVRSQLKSCRICGGQSGARAVLLQVLQLPLPVFIPPTASHSLVVLSSDAYSVSTRR
jgi:hypothetical protein